MLWFAISVLVLALIGLVVCHWRMDK